MRTFEIRAAVRLGANEDPTTVEVVVGDDGSNQSNVLRMMPDDLRNLVETAQAYLTSGIECPVDDPDCTSRDDECHDACERPATAIGTCAPCGQSIFGDERWLNLPPVDGDPAPPMVHAECVPDDADDLTREDAQRVLCGQPQMDWAALDAMARKTR